MINFLLGKALLSLLFYTNNRYFFTTFPKFLSLLFPYFFVEGHLKVWGLKSRGVICISMWLVGGMPLTLASQQVGHVLIVPIKSFKFFLARSVLKNLTLIRPLNFSVFKSAPFWWFYCYNFYHANFDKKID